MADEEFRIARQLILGRSPRRRRPLDTETAVRPAAFREIDGGELARQYVNHRSLMGTESPATAPDEEKALVEEEYVRPLARTPSGSIRSLSRWMRRLWRG
jgi:hypothetical protein